MALCPYGQHRLALMEDGGCKRCGADLRLYMTVRDLPLTWYREARRLQDSAELEAAVACLQAALKMQPDFSEARDLLSSIERRFDSPRHAKSAGPPAGDPRWRRALVAVTGGLVGLLIGVSIISRQQPGAPLQTMRAATSPVSEQKDRSLPPGNQPAMQTADVANAAEFRIVQVNQHAVRIEGEVNSVEEKNLIERALRAAPCMKEVDVRGLRVLERYPVRAGDTLWTLAAKWYRDPTQWRRIADANGLTAPDELHLGSELIIPR